MYRFSSIQKRVALFLLVVFALSATPKPFFHDLLAKHTDGIVCSNQDRSKPCLHRQAYHCSFDDLVVTAPYLSAPPAFSLQQTSFSLHHNTCFQPSVFSSFTGHTASRGPPEML